MEQAEAAAIRARAELELKKIPGVLGVGFGRKETDGIVTKGMALRVYVAAKKPPEELGPEERIPSEFEGVPTDVLVVKAGSSIPCIDQQQHRPLIGGIVITNFKSVANQIEVGTLGFFATLDGVSGPENVVLVSNNHVLMAKGAAVGDTIYQPEYSSATGSPLPVTKTGPVAEIFNEGKKGYENYAYPSESARDYYVDCSSAKLNICISSWCKTNCGVSYKNEIRGLDNGGNSRLEGFVRVSDAEAAAPTDYVVYKVGRTTAKTRGHAKEAFGSVVLDGVLTHGVMIVEPLDPDCDAMLRFSTFGDSGSAVVNEQNRLVGILFGNAFDGSESWVSHIDPVLAVLHVTPISTANPPVPPAGEARSDVHGFFDGVNETVPLRERFLATPIGAEIYREALLRREEIVALVNHRRPVTVAWHRAKGPAFLAHGVENARNPAHLVPREIEGVGRETLARRIAAALAEQGSPELKKAMEQWLPFVLEHLDDFDSLHELVTRLEKEPADA